MRTSVILLILAAIVLALLIFQILGGFTTILAWVFIILCIASGLTRYFEFNRA